MINQKTQERGVLWLTLNNAEQRNPLSSAMLVEMTSSLGAYDDSEIRCIVIAACGPCFPQGIPDRDGQRLGEHARRGRADEGVLKPVRQ